MLLMGFCSATWAGTGFSSVRATAVQSPALQVVQQAQRSVKGHVVDSEGPVISANIQEKGNPKNVSQ